MLEWAIKEIVKEEAEEEKKRKEDDEKGDRAPRKSVHDAERKAETSK